MNACDAFNFSSLQLVSYSSSEVDQVWVAPGIGFADDYLHAFQGAFTDSHVVMAAIFILFAVIHSGMAYLRPYGELKVCCDFESR